MIIQCDHLFLIHTRIKHACLAHERFIKEFFHFTFTKTLQRVLAMGMTRTILVESTRTHTRKCTMKGRRDSVGDIMCSPHATHPPSACLPIRLSRSSIPTHTHTHARMHSKLRSPRNFSRWFWYDGITTDRFKLMFAVIFSTTFWHTTRPTLHTFGITSIRETM